MNLMSTLKLGTIALYPFGMVMAKEVPYGKGMDEGSTTVK